MNPKIILSEGEIKIIREVSKKILGKKSKVYVFGSRVDLTRKGGDIDIYVETNRYVSIKDELKFLAELEIEGIERKVDLVVKAPNKKEKAIFKDAQHTGILL